MHPKSKSPATSPGIILKPRTRRASGFTLIELLTVIGVIAILGTIVGSSVSKLTESGRSTKCLSNLRQLASAAQMYSAENNGLLVPTCAGTTVANALTWRALLVPYLSSESTQNAVFVCPSDTTERNRTLVRDEREKGVRPASYGINGTSYLHQYFGGTAFRVTSVLKPAATIFISDLALVANPNAPIKEWKEKAGGANFGYARFPSDAAFRSGDSWNIYPRHTGRKANAVFYDGHAEAIDIEKALMPYPPGDPNCIYDNK